MQIKINYYKQLIKIFHQIIVIYKKYLIFLCYLFNLKLSQGKFQPFCIKKYYAQIIVEINLASYLK